MSEIDRAVLKPKPYVWLQTSDGSINEVEQDIAMHSPLMCREIVEKGMGSSKNSPVCLPERVTPETLSLILDYFRFHQVPGRSNKERKSHDEKFVKIGTNRLCDVACAAESLQLKPLVELTSHAIARIIEDKSPEEVRDMLGMRDDLTEEEKLAPLKNIIGDPTIRLWNVLNARKLKERERLKNLALEEEQVKEGPVEDERSVDELLSFINGNDAAPKPTKNKKKNRKKKDKQKSSSVKGDCELNKIAEITGHDIKNESAKSGEIAAEDDIFSHNEFDDGDDEIDPEIKEKIDREVEDFARRLNSDWPERIRDFLSSGQERKSTPFTTNGNGFLRRNTCMPSPTCFQTELTTMEMNPYRPTHLQIA